MMTERRFQTAVKLYNELMNDIGREEMTIGTAYTEDPENKAKWNIRDMVSECQYHADCAQNWIDELGGWDDDDENEDLIHYKQKKKKVMAFVNRYKKDIEGYVTARSHCSKFDN